MNRFLKYRTRFLQRLRKRFSALSEPRGGRFKSVLAGSTKEFLERFDLETVHEHLAMGDEKEAEAALLSHLRERVVSNWLAPPDELTDLRLRLDDLSTEDLLREAEAVLEQRVTPASEQPRLSSRGVIDWVYNPTTDREWLFKINRHAWWIVLGVAYRETGDDRYAARFVEQLVDWIDHNPPPPRKDEKSPTWRLMEVALRMRVSWLPAFGMFFDAPSFTDEAKLKFLRSCCDHGRFLLQFKTNRNHLLRESNGLAYLAATLPEFADARYWLECALERIEGEVREQVNEDGTHIEMSTGYQWLVIDELERTADLLRTHGLRMPNEDLEATLERMYEILARVLLPDGTMPQINDGFLLWPHTRLAAAGRRFGRDDFVFAGTDGAEGEPQAQTSCHIRDAGLHVMRSDWTTDARYLLFDVGPHGGFHGHEDKLSLVELYAYGVRFLADPGSFTYDKKNPFRRYFASSSGHNTVLVDGKSQVRVWNRAYLSPRVARGDDYSTWVSRAGFDYAAGRYDEGYGEYRHSRPDDAVRLDGVVHERRVLFVKSDFWIVVDDLQAEHAHQYQWLFHAPRVFSVSQQDGGTILGTGDDTPHLLLQPDAPELYSADTYCGSEDPVQGWYSRDHRAKEPATAIAYHRSSESSCRAAFLLFPARCRASLSSVRFENLEVDTAAAYVVTHGDGERDYVLLAEEPAERELGGCRVNGTVAVVRKSAEGEVLCCEDWSSAASPAALALGSDC